MRRRPSGLQCEGRKSSRARKALIIYSCLLFGVAMSISAACFRMERKTKKTKGLNDE